MTILLCVEWMGWSTSVSYPISEEISSTIFITNHLISIDSTCSSSSGDQTSIEMGVPKNTNPFVEL